MKKSSHTSSGLSLAEIVIVIGIVSLLTIAISSFQRNILYFTGFLEDAITGAQDARAVLRTMAKEGRSASPSSLGAYPLATVSAQTFMFYSDIDADGLKERVRYFLSGTELRKGVIKPSGVPLQYNPASEQISILIHGVRNGAQSMFEYYDTNYDGTTAPLTQPVSSSAVRLVKVTVIVDDDINKAPIARAFTTQVTFRNLKDNL